MTRLTARVEGRLSPEALALMKQAAAIEGRSLSDFVVGAAHAAARNTLERHASGDDQADNC